MGDGGDLAPAAHVEQIGTGKVDRREAGAGEVGAPQAGVGERRRAQVGAPEAGAVEPRAIEARTLEVGLLEARHRQRRETKIDRFEPRAVEIDAGERDVVAYEIGERVDASSRAALPLRAVDDLPGLIVGVPSRPSNSFRLGRAELSAIRPELVGTETERSDLEQPDDVDGVLQPLRPDGSGGGGHPREHDGEITEQRGDSGDREDQPASASHVLQRGLYGMLL